MNQIDVSVAGIEPPPWLDRLQPFCETVLDRLDIHDWEVSILLCDDHFIRDLNQRFRGKDEPTDVLSFSQREDDEDWPADYVGKGIHSAGDIVISLPTVERNSEQYSVDMEEELKRLLIHGLLHLKGMRHEGSDPEQDMLRLQEEILKGCTEERLF